MAGPKMAEKSNSYDVTTPEIHQSCRGQRRGSVLIAVVASLSTALVLGSIFFALIVILQEKKVDEKPEWISWIRKTGDVDIHESALIDDKKETILMVSAEAYRIREENSMALHDFKLGYVALRDFKYNKCFVTKVKIPDFLSVKQTVEARQNKILDLQPLKDGKAQLRNMTSSELGPILSQFCDGVPAHWFDVTKKGAVKRQLWPVIIEPTFWPPIIGKKITLPCLHNRLAIGTLTR